MSFMVIYLPRLLSQIEPRSMSEIKAVLQVPIPVYAIGGITEDTIQRLPNGFAGICAISYFMSASLQQIQHLRKEWLKDA